MPDSAGNTLWAAKEISFTSGLQTFTDRVDAFDTNDYYRIDLKGRSSLQLSITGLSANADLQLLDRNGNVLQASTNGAGLPESINHVLNADVYYIRVYPSSGGNDTDYTLNLTVQNNPKTEIFWRDYTNGSNGFWVMGGANNDTISSIVMLPSASTNWHVEGIADFNGDNRPDLLWRDYVNGSNGVWMMGGANNDTISSVVMLPSASTNWHVEGIADFNGDNRPDLLWRDYVNGSNGVWLMGGANNDTISSIVMLPSASTNWHIEGIADFNGDNRPDLLWRDYAGGANGVWMMGGANNATISSIVMLPSATTNWHIEGITDFNRDNRPDLLWRDYSNGSNGVWMMGGANNATISSVVMLPSATTNWQAIPYTRYTDPLPIEVPSTYLPFDPSKVFSLSSNPGANHTIYLDFDGHVTTDTFWNTVYTNGQPIVTPAFDMDGDPSSFSTAELETIWHVWQRVAEDFAPFNVNVTTALPSLDRLIKSGNNDTQWGIRVVIGGDSSWFGSVSGISYRGSFNWDTDTPAFAFSRNLSEKMVAETISHEVGHTLGLSHDGQVTSQYTQEYYIGHGSGATSWAPIMGAGEQQALSQWSRGEYANATNTEDDLAIITTQNGFGYRVDDYGNQFNTAALLRLNGTRTETYGMIETNTDVDYFSFTSSTGKIALSIQPFVRGPNLDILAALYDASGQLIQVSNPTDELFASFDLNLTPGQYYLVVRGTGKGDVNTGYSAYGSLGQYSITGTIA